MINRPIKPGLVLALSIAGLSLSLAGCNSGSGSSSSGTTSSSSSSGSSSTGGSSSSSSTAYWLPYAKMTTSTTSTNPTTTATLYAAYSSNPGSPVTFGSMMQGSSGRDHANTDAMTANSTTTGTILTANHPKYFYYGSGGHLERLDLTAKTLSPTQVSNASFNTLCSMQQDQTDLTGTTGNLLFATASSSSNCVSGTEQGWIVPLGAGSNATPAQTVVTPDNEVAELNQYNASSSTLTTNGYIYEANGAVYVTTDPTKAGTQVLSGYAQDMGGNGQDEIVGVPTSTSSSSPTEALYDISVSKATPLNVSLPDSYLVNTQDLSTHDVYVAAQGSNGIDWVQVVPGGSTSPTVNTVANTSGDQPLSAAVSGNYLLIAYSTSSGTSWGIVSVDLTKKTAKTLSVPTSQYPYLPGRGLDGSALVELDGATNTASIEVFDASTDQLTQPAALKSIDLAGYAGYSVGISAGSGASALEYSYVLTHKDGTYSNGACTATGSQTVNVVSTQSYQATYQFQLPSSYSCSFRTFSPYSQFLAGNAESTGTSTPGALLGVSPLAGNQLASVLGVNSTSSSSSTYYQPLLQQ